MQPSGRGAYARSLIAARTRASKSLGRRNSTFSARLWMMIFRATGSGSYKTLLNQFRLNLFPGTRHGRIALPFSIGCRRATCQAKFIQHIPDGSVIRCGEEDCHIFAASFDDDVRSAGIHLVKQVAPFDACFAALDSRDRYLPP
jgi:hypothetical protein